MSCSTSVTSLLVLAAVGLSSGLRCSVTGPGGPDVDKPCKFPFKYRGAIYNACTNATDPDGKFWCSTKVDEHGRHLGGTGNWGYCTCGSNQQSRTTTTEATTTVANAGLDTRPLNKSLPLNGTWLPAPEKQECGFKLRSDYIYGGRNASIGEFPFTVLLAYPNPNTGEILYACGGSLINTRYVLTAAHCQYVTPARIPISEVVVGELVVGQDPDCPHCSPVQRFKVTEADVVVHEKWNGKAVNLGNDIAIIRLPANVETAFDHFGTFVLPVCLPRDEDDVVGPLLTAIGWGKTEGPSDFSKLSVYKGALQAVDVPAFDKQQCAEVFQKELADNVFCSGGEKGRDSCQGDSGGPLISRVASDGYMFLAGIVSFGKASCGIEGSPGVYTDVRKHMAWIRDHLHE